MSELISRRIFVALLLMTDALAIPAVSNLPSGMCREKNFNITMEMKDTMTRCFAFGMKTTGKTPCTPLCLASELDLFDRENLSSDFIRSVFPKAMYGEVDKIETDCVARYGNASQLLPIDMNDCSRFEPLMRCATDGVKQECGAVRETRDPFTIIAAVAVIGAIAKLIPEVTKNVVKSRLTN